MTTLSLSTQSARTHLQWYVTINCNVHCKANHTHLSDDTYAHRMSLPSIAQLSIDMKRSAYPTESHSGLIPPARRLRSLTESILRHFDFEQFYDLNIYQGVYQLESVTNETKSISFVETVQADDQNIMIDNIMAIIRSFVTNFPDNEILKEIDDDFVRDDRRSLPENGKWYYIQQVKDTGFSRRLFGGFGINWVSGHAPNGLTDEEAFRYIRSIFNKAYSGKTGRIWDSFTNMDKSVPIRLIDIPSKEGASQLLLDAAKNFEVKVHKENMRIKNSLSLWEVFLKDVPYLRKLDPNEMLQLRNLPRDHSEGYWKGQSQNSAEYPDVATQIHAQSFDDHFEVKFVDALTKMIEFMENGGVVDDIGLPNSLMSKIVGWASPTACVLCYSMYNKIELVGNMDFEIEGVPVSHGFVHYVKAHQIWPSQQFYEAVRKAANTIHNHVSTGAISALRRAGRDTFQAVQE